ncbi:hypothetical protein BH24CHL4_BH24CHL4_21450 [soil metagenome]
MVDYGHPIEFGTAYGLRVYRSYPPIRLSAYPPIRLSAYPPIRLSACPPVRLSACPPVRLSACPPIRLSASNHPVHVNMIDVLTAAQRTSRQAAELDEAVLLIETVG